MSDKRKPFDKFTIHVTAPLTDKDKADAAAAKILSEQMGDNPGNGLGGSSRKSRKSARRSSSRKSRKSARRRSTKGARRRSTKGARKSRKGSRKNRK